MSEMRFLECRFHPYARNHYYITETTPKGPTDFRVSWPADKPLPGEASRELAEFKDRPECPEWAREWEGEYYVEILSR